MRIAIIVGSVRQTVRMADRILPEILKIVEKNYDIEVIDLREINLPMLSEPEQASTGIYKHKTTIDWSEKIKGFDGIVFLSPTYNHSIPAPIKNAIDHLYNEWLDKKFGVIVYGWSGYESVIDQFNDILSDQFEVQWDSTTLPMREVLQDNQIKLRQIEIDSINRIFNKIGEGNEQ